VDRWRRALEAIRLTLPEDLQQAIANVSFELRAEPTAIDYARGGATPGHIAYYYGDSRELDNGTALPDDSSPHGVIVVFVGRVRPLTLKRFTEVVCHEILHVLGYEEREIVYDFGLAP
jgi:hypothetical protein